MDNSKLDASIDQIARRMTAGSPSSAFQSRVAARLDARRCRPWFWMAGLTATAGAVAIAVVASLDRGIGLSSQSPVSTSAAIAVPPAALEPPPDSTPKPKSRTVERRTQEPSILRPRDLDSERLAWEARALPALDAPEAPRAIADIQPEPLEIRPLVTPALSVPAIGEEEDNETHKTSRC